jgi:hypothetical protein
MEQACEVCGEASPFCERCDLCKRLACQDCLHEADCCFLEADDHNDDPAWAPPGWKIAKVEGTFKEWQRL